MNLLRLAPILFFLCLLHFTTGCTPEEEDQLDEILVSPELSSVPRGTVTLAGRVVDDATGSPLSGALVSTIPTTTLLQTNVLGEFVITEGLRAGELYRVDVDATDYGSGSATIVAELDQEPLEVRLVSLERSVPMAISPETLGFSPAVHVNELTLVSRSADPFQWVVDEASSWLVVEPTTDTLSPERPGKVEVRLNAAEFAAIAATREVHYGYIRFRDDRDRILYLNAVAIPAGTVILEAALDDYELLAGRATLLRATLRTAGQALLGGEVSIVVEGPGGLEHPDGPFTTDRNGVSVIPLTSTSPGPVSVTLRVPGAPETPAVTLSLQIGSDTDPCAFQNGGCGPYATCALDETFQVICEDVDLCAVGENGRNACGIAQHWSCEDHPLAAPTCDPVDYCTEAANPCAPQTERCVNRPGNLPQCEPLGLPVIQDLQGPFSPTNQSLAEFTFACSAPPCTFHCEITGATGLLFLDPDCTSPLTFPTLDGTYAFTVSATDANGQESAEAVWDWLVDTEIPVVSIESGPAPITRDPNTQFEFTCSKAECFFSCELSEATAGTVIGPVSCGGLFQYPLTTDGAYTLTVLGSDLAGNAGPAATWSFRLDRSLPQVTLLTAPSALSTEPSAAFTLSCSKPLCQLFCTVVGQSQGFIAQEEDCSGSTPSYTGLTDDTYTFAVYAIDQAGNTSASVLHQWVVTSPPAVFLETSPEVLTNDPWLQFAFSCSQPPCTFECAMAGPLAAPAESCNNPLGVTYTDRPDGEYIFEVIATNSAGLSSPPLAYSFTIDTVPPQLEFTQGPPEIITENWAAFEFQCQGEPCTYSCTLMRQGAVFSPGSTCESPRSEGDLVTGDYEFIVEARDLAGNATTESYTFRVALPGWSQISTGPAHSCAIATDQSLWCWGEGGSNRLGNGGTTPVSFPIQVGIDQDWAQVSAGTEHSCGVRTDGTLWCWGNGATGRLGTGDTSNRLFPARIGLATDWTYVEAAWVSTCGLRSDGDLYCWGGNAYGRLGTGDTETALTPALVSGGWWIISLGPNHGCGVRTDGALFCWGRGFQGRLGNGSTGDQWSPVQVTIEDPPFELAEVVPYVAVSAGDSHSCGVRADGSLFCWGHGAEGKLGRGATGDTTRPAVVAGDFIFDWVDVTASAGHTCGLRQDDSLWCWGLNNFGQLGAESPNQNLPAPVNEDIWVQISSQGPTTCAINWNDELYCWGFNRVGQLGLGMTPGANSLPAPREGLFNAVAIAAGQFSSCLITEDQDLYCWGHNRFGLLGTGDFNDRSLPTPVDSDQGVWAQVAMAVGNDNPPSTATGHTCATRTDGTLWCWGWGASGRLGLGDMNSRSRPTQVAPGTTWEHLTLGRAHTCGIQTDGTLWCWGSNANDRLGTGSAAGSVSSPMQVGGGSDWVDVAASETSTCALREDGTLWCWGSGTFGSNNSTNEPLPVQVEEDQDWTRVFQGQSHRCALKDDGTLWCWGNGASGRLGLNDTSNQLSPTRVGAATSWVAIDLGYEHSCGRTSSGHAYCWGRNNTGMVGDGTFTDKLVPTALPGSDWTAVAAGGRHTLGLRSVLQGFSSWGSNFRAPPNTNPGGQLGDGTAFSRVPLVLEDPL